MCVARITNSDVPADCLDAFDSDEDAPDPIEDEHHAIFKCSDYATTKLSDLLPAMYPWYPLSARFWTSLIAIAWPSF